MFPHTITIYIYDEEKQVYTKQIVKGVYWTNSDSTTISENRSHSGTGTIVIPKALMDSVKVENGCYIAKGEHDDISSIKDLENVQCIQVSSIQINDVGWDIDNITISGS